MHPIRHSPDCVTWAKRKAVAAARRPIYTAPTAAAAETALTTFEAGEWGLRHPTLAAGWRRHWERVIPFFVFPPEIRRVIYTPNAIESLHRRLRNITADWSNAAREWRAAMKQFAIPFADSCALIAAKTAFVSPFFSSTGSAHASFAGTGSVRKPGCGVAWSSTSAG